LPSLLLPSDDFLLFGITITLRLNLAASGPVVLLGYFCSWLVYGNHPAASTAAVLRAPA